MKNPKKLFAFLLVAVLLVSSCSSVFAEDTISADAKTCADLGVLIGEGSGVTAEYTAKTPVRIQAAIIYLRLKGLYEEALAFTGSENFTDAASTFADGQKILAYLKANSTLGWIGNPDGTFAPNEVLTAQQYYKVMLSTLGYIQDLDFTYADVFTFAAEKGMSKITADMPFTVDSLAVATVEALNAGIYGDDTLTLAGQLVAAGKLDAVKAAAANLLLVPASLAKLVDSTATYMSTGENLGWQKKIYTLGENTTGKQYATFNMTALIEKADASVDFADSDKEVLGFADLAMLIRMNDQGNIDVRNGLAGNKQVADVVYPYTANVTYRIEVEADMDAKTYSVWATAPDGVKTQIAKDYGFRTSAADTDDMGKVFFVSASDNNQMKVENFRRFAMLDSTASYLSTGENMGWQAKGMYLGSNNTGKQQINFDMTPVYDAALIDGSTDFADSGKTVGGFSDLAMLIRMCKGTIDVRNGLAGNAQMSDTKIDIITGTVYHIEIIANMDAKTYSVWVTPDGGVKTQIAKDYGFRTSAAETTDDVGQVFFVSSDDNGWIKTSNITIKAVQ